MQNQTTVGKNRTGIAMSPMDSNDVITYAQQASIRPDGEGFESPELANARLEHIAEADPLGSVPPPGSVKGAAQTVIGKLTGKSPEVLIDKIGERLAFERSGVRLYTAFIEKCRGADGAGFNVPVQQAERFCQEEAEHFTMLAECLKTMGADPTAQTPSADATAVSTYGVMQVLTDPRTTIGHCLEALLTVELTDNVAWQTLIVLARQMGHDDMVAKFEQALQQEAVHMNTVQGWYQEAVMHDAGVGQVDTGSAAQRPTSASASGTQGAPPDEA